MSAAQPPKTEAYLTKEALNRATRKGSMQAAKQAMEIAGSVVTVKDGWVVRQFRNGSIERLEKLPDGHSSSTAATK
jgi:hypothetical protein